MSHLLLTMSNPSILQCKVHTAASSRIVHHAVKLRSFQTDSTVLSFFTLLFMEAMPWRLCHLVQVNYWIGNQSIAGLMQLGRQLFLLFCVRQEDNHCTTLPHLLRINGISLNLLKYNEIFIYIQSIKILWNNLKHFCLCFFADISKYWPF